MSDESELPPGFSPPGHARSPLTIRQGVSWSDVDAYGHVNNAVYLTWFENARFHYFDLTGVSAWYRMERVGPILARTEVDFLAPVGFPEELLVSVRVTRIGNSSLRTENLAWSLGRARMAARAVQVIVIVDYAAGGTPVRVPEPLRAAMRAFEGPGVEEG